MCSWSNRCQKIQHCKHSTRVNNDCIRALYGRGSCLEFHISYVFLRANWRRWNRMICVPAGQKTSHGYNTQLLWALHFSNSCKIVQAYRCYSLFLSLPSVRQTESSSSQACWACFPKDSPERFQFFNYSWTWKCLPQVLHGLKNLRGCFYCFPLFILVAVAAHNNCSERPTAAPVLWICFSPFAFIMKCVLSQNSQQSLISLAEKRWSLCILVPAICLLSVFPRLLQQFGYTLGWFCLIQGK